MEYMRYVEFCAALYKEMVRPKRSIAREKGQAVAFVATDANGKKKTVRFKAKAKAVTKAVKERAKEKLRSGGGDVVGPLRDKLEIRTDARHKLKNHCNVTQYNLNERHRGYKKGSEPSQWRKDSMLGVTGKGGAAVYGYCHFKRDKRVPKGGRFGKISIKKRQYPKKK